MIRCCTSSVCSFKVWCLFRGVQKYNTCGVDMMGACAGEAGETIIQRDITYARPLPLGRKCHVAFFSVGLWVGILR